MRFLKVLKVLLIINFLSLLVKPCVPTYANENDNSEDLMLKTTLTNSIEIKLSTNNLSFVEFIGGESSSLEVGVLVNSNLNYDIDVKLDNEIKSLDGNNVINKDYLSLSGEDGEIKFEEINSYVNIISNAQKGKDIIHYFDINLYSDALLKKGDYKTSLTFQATQR